MDPRAKHRPVASIEKPIADERPPVPVPVRRTQWAWLLSTGLGIGYLKPGPGTWASAVTVLLWWAAAVLLIPEGWHLLVAAALTVLVIAVAIPAATIVARESGIKDPFLVVSDEVAGQLVPLIIAPVGWKYMLASLILFRCFDVIKPPPVRQLERLPGGVGIVLDDVAAGCMAAVVLALLVAFGVTL